MKISNKKFLQKLKISGWEITTLYQIGNFSISGYSAEKNKTITFFEHKQYYTLEDYQEFNLLEV